MLLPAQPDWSDDVDRFEATARAAGVKHVSEGCELDPWLQRVRQQRRPLLVERLSNPMLEAVILPESGGRIWRLSYLPSGQDVLLVSGRPGEPPLTEFGYEEYSRHGYHSPGWCEVYTVRERTECSVTLEADLANGLRICRRLEIDPQLPKLQISSTVTNAGRDTAPVGLRVHACFAVADTSRATVWVRRSDGSMQSLSLATPQDPMAEREVWFRGADRPNGEWAIVDKSRGITLVDRFQLDQVGTCYLNWSGRQGRGNLELWSPATVLAPGASLTVDHAYEVTTSFEPNRKA